MCTSACMWDNGLVNQKEGQMKPIEVTKQGVPGHTHTSVTRHDEVDPDFGFGSSCGAFDPETAALDRIGMPIH